jgi:hypothetical protein
MVCLCLAQPVMASVPARGRRHEPTVALRPALYPHFQPSIVDYVSKCDSARRIVLSISAPRGTSVSVNDARWRRGAFSVALVRGAGQSFHFVVRGAKDGIARYHVRCLPHDFPSWTTGRSGATEAQWYAVTPSFTDANGDLPPVSDDEYVILFDNNGVPVWWTTPVRPGVPVPDSRPIDAKLLPDGNIGWSRVGEGNLAEEHRLDGSLVRTLNTVGAMRDPHELTPLPNGDFFMVADRERPGVNLSPWGGPRRATVQDQEIQEVSPSGSLVWSWDLMDHIPLSEVKRSWWHAEILAEGSNFDVYHTNSIDQKGNTVLISLRHEDAVYAVDRATGRIEWKLGGTRRTESLAVNGDPVFADGETLGGQHDARFLPNGTISLYDNGAPSIRPPRVVRYRIDPRTRRARLLEQILDPLASSSYCCGSSRRLKHGAWVVAWRQAPLVSEFAASGRPVFALEFNGGRFTYRADPIPYGRLDRAALRRGMDAQYPCVTTWSLSYYIPAPVCSR